MPDTKLLLHSDGSNGSTTFVDETGKTITAVVTAQISTTAPKFGTGSCLLDGNSDYLTTPDSTEWIFGTNNFTLDMWWKPAGTATAPLIGQYANSSNTWRIVWDSNKLYFFVANLLNYSIPFTPTTGNWYHIAVVRKGTGGGASDWLTFVNGVPGTKTLNGGAYNITMPNIASVLYIGVVVADGAYLNGNLDEIRVSTTARWTADFSSALPTYSYSINVPTVSTDSASDIQTTTVILNGTITNSGGGDNDERGFDWGTEAGVYTDSWTEVGSFSAESFNHQITGLSADTEYFFRAKTHNSVGWGYGSELSFFTDPASVISDSFDLSWTLLKTFQDSFYLSWYLTTLQSSDFSLNWKIKYEDRFYNIQDYEIDQESPVLKSYTFIAPISGCLDSISVNIGDSGRSGTNIIKLYLEGVLIDTETIAAANTSSNTLKILENNIIHRGDEIIITIDTLAVDIMDLNVVVHQKTFTEEIGILKILNEYSGVSFESDYLYGVSANWKFVLDQPIKELSTVMLVDNDNNFHETDGILEAGLMGDNIIRMAPEDLTNTKYISLTVVNQNDDIKIIQIPVHYNFNIADYPNYLYSAFSFKSFITATKVYYSWDNSSWLEATLSNNQITISTLPVSTGAVILYVRYYLDLVGENVVYDEFDMTYLTATPTTDIDFVTGTLTYTDTVNPKKIEIYVENELVETIDTFISTTGFGTLTFDNTTLLLSLAAGVVYVNGQTITKTQTDFTLTFSTDVYQYKLIYLNTYNYEIEIKDIDWENYINVPKEEFFAVGIIPLWVCMIGDGTYTDISTGTTVTTLSLDYSENIYSAGLIPSKAGTSVDYKIQDEFGREKTITLDSYSNSIVKDYKYNLTVTDIAAAEIKPGEIHNKASLIYKMEAD